MVQKTTLLAKQSKNNNDAGKGSRFNIPKQQKIEKKYKMEKKSPFQNL